VGHQLDFESYRGYGELTVKSERDKPLRSRVTERDYTEMVRRLNADNARFELPIFAHDGPCFVGFSFGAMNDGCQCIRFMQNGES